MSDYFEMMKKVTEDHAIALGAKISGNIRDAHNDNIEEWITVCEYCGTQTLDPCCGENHHVKMSVDKDGNEVILTKEIK